MKERLHQSAFSFLLLFPFCAFAQSFPDLTIDSGSVRVPGKMYYQTVSITGGACISYDPEHVGDGVLGVTCNSFLLDALSSVIVGATSFYHANSVPLSILTTGSPDVIVQEYGVTEGNGAGTYGGRGFNPFGAAKEPYGPVDGFGIQLGSMGTRGETFRMWYGGGWVTVEGRGAGRAGGATTIIGNEVTIGGRVNADGENGWGDVCDIQYPGYSGSGGGILIAAKNLTITSTARITANGGEYAIKEPCEDYGIPFHYHYDLIGKRDGGGGRIKIFYEQGTISPEAVIEAKGYEDGTVHIQQVRSVDQLLNPGDLNGDGVTNHEDLFLLQQSWQQAVTPVPSPEETPTPTATPAP